nr:MAG: coat protein [Myotis brandtii tymo-like virus 1]
MESLVPLAADLAISSAPALINALMPSKDSSTNSLPDHNAGVALPAQSLPQAPPPPIGSSLGHDRSGVTIPFQFWAAGLRGTEKNIYTVTVNSLDVITRHTKYYRDAQLTHLEAVVYPTSNSYKIPVTVDLVWTPADVTLSTGEVMKTPGSAKITVGGLNLVNHGVLACDLGYVNPILKSPIPYTNSPRLNIDFHQSPEAVAEGTRSTEKGDVYIRGVVRLSHPICVP